MAATEKRVAKIKLTENAEKSDNRHSNTLEKKKRSCLVTTFRYVPLIK
jgi:hypothetical protein